MQLAVRLRRTATEREVADALGLPPRELGAAAAPRCSASSSCARAAAAVSLDILADAGPDPAAAHQEQETRRQLWCAVGQLGERDRLVLRLYYLEDRTLAEIGRMLGVTESRVSQLHCRLVARLRVRLAELSPLTERAGHRQQPDVPRHRAARAGRGSCPARAAPPSAGRPPGSPVTGDEPAQHGSRRDRRPGVTAAATGS